MNEAYHIPVLLQETIEALHIQPEGIYVDATFGGGGHSKVILDKLGPSGKLIAFDQDADAQKNISNNSRMEFIPQNFRYLQRFLKLKGIREVNGILADLGVSSHQFDEPERGFSIRYNGPLDMRMDQRQTKTAASIVKTFSEAQLHKMFEQYGEVTNSKTLARQIVEVRNSRQIETIEDFKTALRPVVKGNPNKYFAQVFQALRIEVNEEMDALKEMLEQVPDLLVRGGRVAVITFHSIEDRLVKQFFKMNTFEEADENPFSTAEVVRHLVPVNKKPITAGENELKTNSRSRSAKLRVAEKI